MKQVIFDFPETASEALKLLVSSESDSPILNIIPTPLICQGVLKYLDDNPDNYLPPRVMYVLEKRLNLSESIFECKKFGKDAENPPSGFDAYPYIPLWSDEFIFTMHKATKLLRTKTDTIRFVDAGSGMGDKVLLAQTFFDCVFKTTANIWEGVEYNPFLVSPAKALRRTINVKQGDITTWDFKSYNLIYAYNPMTRPDGMEAFFKNVINTADDDIICVFYNVDSGWHAMSNPEIKKHFESNDGKLFLFHKEA
jgi:hypothetical protein